MPLFQEKVGVNVMLFGVVNQTIDLFVNKNTAVALEQAFKNRGSRVEVSLSDVGENGAVLSISMHISDDSSFENEDMQGMMAGIIGHDEHRLGAILSRADDEESLDQGYSWDDVELEEL